MGLDIHISTDKDKEVYTIDFYRNDKEFRYKMSLSREFCNLMCRQHVSTGLPEFSQIGRFADVDIEPILEMEKYLDEESGEFLISSGESVDDRLRISNKIQSDRESLKGNIDKVHNCVGNLIDKLSRFDNLNNKIVVHGVDTIGIDFYFGDFNSDPGDGYIGNNFGQDLRNFKRLLEHAKSKGATTVHFNYG